MPATPPATGMNQPGPFIHRMKLLCQGKSQKIRKEGGIKEEENEEEEEKKKRAQNISVRKRKREMKIKEIARATKTELLGPQRLS